MRVSLILPTYNEASNLTEVLERVHETLDPFEVIVVDDNSPDRTWELAGALQSTYPSLRVIRRVGRRGLSSAVIEGFEAAKGDMFIVMDADLQHDPTLLPRIQNAIGEGAQVALASRYTEGGDTKDWRWIRRMLSRTATHLVQLLVPQGVTDPMSGFFAVRRETYRSVASHLRPQGFKILFEILSFLPRGTRIAEVPFHFGIRERGKSKLTLLVQMQFLWQVLRTAVRRLQIPLFVVISGIITIVCLWRLWDLRLLYTNATYRSYVHQGMTSLSDARGWPLSDLSVRAVYSDRVRLIHRVHRKGPDAVDCLDLPFESDAVLPCSD